MPVKKKEEEQAPPEPRDTEYKITTFLKDPDGFSNSISVIGNAEALDDWRTVIAALKEEGFTPDRKGSGGGSSGGGGGGVETKPCPVHEGLSLYHNTSKKTGKKYWGHKAEDGGMCFGR